MRPTRSRAFVTKQSRTIGLIVGDIIDCYFAEIASGVEDCARRAGSLTIVYKADRSPERERTYLRLLKGHRAGGVVFAGGTFTDSSEVDALRADVAQAVAKGLRIVDLGERGFMGVPTNTVDNRAVLADITTFLITQGHRHIAFLEGPPGFPTSHLRLQGYLDAMREADLAPAVIAGVGFDFESGRAAALRLLGAALPDAIIAFSVESALGVLMALRQAGVEVPGRISVAGVDGTHDASDASLVDLTTVKLPMYELGSAAARLVEADGELPPTRTIFPHRVIPRGTTARAHATGKLASWCGARRSRPIIHSRRTPASRAPPGRSCSHGVLALVVAPVPAARSHSEGGAMVGFTQDQVVNPPRPTSRDRVRWGHGQHQRREGA